MEEVICAIVCMLNYLVLDFQGPTIALSSKRRRNLLLRLLVVPQVNAYTRKGVVVSSCSNRIANGHQYWTIFQPFLRLHSSSWQICFYACSSYRKVYSNTTSSVLRRGKP